MMTYRVAGAVLLALTWLGMQDASALSVDDHTMNTGDNASRFSDPDEHMPVQNYYESTQSPAFGEQNDNNTAASGNTPPSAALFSPSNDYRLNKR